MSTESSTVTSKDGTRITFEQSGAGPVLIIVSAALADHSGTTKLAKLLTGNFTVVNYDRRGRGDSGDTQPYATEREIEDIAALIDASGGRAFLFGSSSGAVLALDATAELGARVGGVLLYEPPFIIDSSRPPVPEGLAEEAEQSVSADRRNDAVKLFFTKGMGMPAFAVTMMRLFMPGWSKMAAIAHTLPYDLAIVAGTQSGKPLPVERWAGVEAPILVAVGSKSPAFFHDGAKSLAESLPRTTYRSLTGDSHASVMMRPKGIAATASEFFLDGLQ
ncbi:MAG: alpha/beta hydrolase fold [Nocardia sp.]|uniref:alpha/beta fold hydrolase n=1 Tax=Nocardia sp. TaxID=1821 RepID=UPI00261B59C7|nr:alpha/beta hydrolase [Nocardia sp.]MCU1641413.1 alpha/beta hydrolase fold [Nocardia sp.]